MAGLSVPRPQTQTTQGVPFHGKAVTTSTPGTQQILIQLTVPVGVLRSLTLALVVARFEGRWLVDVDGDVVGSGRTGPGQESIFQWFPSRPVAAASIIRLLFTQRPNTPAAPIEGYMMASDTTA